MSLIRSKKILINYNLTIPGRLVEPLYMELIKKKSLESLTTRNSVPCSEGMKQQLDTLKTSFDINEMTRKFWADLIKRASGGIK